MERPTDTLTLETFKAAVANLKQAHVPPAFKIRTQAEADKANAVMEALGLDHIWHVGDEYYFIFF